MKHTNTKTYRLLQVQERLTGQISASLEEQMNPLGVMVFIEATHMCMAMRGVRHTSASTVTSCLLGDFKVDAATRSEFFAIALRDSPARHDHDRPGSPGSTAVAGLTGAPPCGCGVQSSDADSEHRATQRPETVVASDVMVRASVTVSINASVGASVGVAAHPR